MPTSHRSERGQIVPMVTMLLPILLLFVALVVNVGQGINRRVAVQMLADTSAFTGATVMAVHLNQIAWTNEQLQRAWVAMTYPTGFLKFAPFCGLNDAAVNAYKGLSTGLRGMITTFNATGKLRAISEANRVAFGETGNSPELFPGEAPASFGFNAYTTAGIVPSASPNLTEIQEVEDGANPDAADEFQLPIPGWLSKFLGIDYSARKSPNWVCVQQWVIVFGVPVPVVILPRSETFQLWVKETAPPETFVTHITAPEVPARLFPNIFGNIPPMTAAAAAQPTGGNIEQGRNEYIVKMVPVGSAFSPFDTVNMAIPARFILH